MNILFLSRGIIAKQCFDLIMGSKHEQTFRVKAIVSTETDYEEYVNKFPGNTFQWISNAKRNENDILSAIKSLNINLLISVQHNWILSEKILDAVGGNAFNLHNAKLPDYKGYNTISHALYNGEKTYTTTIHWIVPEVDMGDVAYEQTIDVENNETAESLFNKSVKAAVINFQELIENLANNKTITRKPITNQGRFYKRNEIDGLREIKSRNDFEEVDKKSRAFYIPPHEQAFYILNGSKVYVTPIQD